MSKPKKTESRSKALRPRRDKEFLRLPRFEGGMDALRTFIDSNLTYPAQALEQAIEGDVHVKYEVNESGRVTEARVLRGVGAGCDEEALRIVRMLTFTPVRNRGQRVTSHFEIILHFRLPAPVPTDVPAVPPLQVTYSFVPASPAIAPMPSPIPADDTERNTVVASAGINVVFPWTGGPQ
ncbi:MAG: energy transducer TonB [Candidatus Kapaibacterium sp.]